MKRREVLKRSIELKKQGRDLITSEILDLNIRLALVILKERLEKQMAKKFDLTLSRKLDCIAFLLES